jgi:hypothetical protein
VVGGVVLSGGAPRRSQLLARELRDIPASHMNSSLVQPRLAARSYNKKSTLTSREIQTSVRLMLPGELAKHAVSEGTKAVTVRPWGCGREQRVPLQQPRLTCSHTHTHTLLARLCHPRCRSTRRPRRKRRAADAPASRLWWAAGGRGGRVAWRAAHPLPRRAKNNSIEHKRRRAGGGPTAQATTAGGGTQHTTQAALAGWGGGGALALLRRCSTNYNRHGGGATHKTI